MQVVHRQCLIGVVEVIYFEIVLFSLVVQESYSQRHWLFWVEVLDLVAVEQAGAGEVEAVAGAHVLGFDQVHRGKWVVKKTFWGSKEALFRSFY